MHYTGVQWINFCLGISLISAALVTRSHGIVLYSNTITGTAIIIIALVSFLGSKTREGGYVSTLNIVTGFWAMISPAFILNAQLAWQNFVLGTLTVMTALISVAVHELHIRLLKRGFPDAGGSP